MTERDPKLETKAVDAFLWVQRALTDLLKNGKYNSPLDREIWALTHNARLFVVDPETMGRLYRAADMFTTAKIGKLPWLPGVVDDELLKEVDGGVKALGESGRTLAILKPGQARDAGLHAMAAREGIAAGEHYFYSEEAQDLSVERSLQFTRAVHEAGMEVPVPERLPFDSIFVCYGGHILLGPGQRFIRRLDIEKTKSTRLIGHLMAFTKDEFKAYEVLSIGEKTKPWPTTQPTLGTVGSTRWI
jgi:hypothetical protein